MELFWQMIEAHQQRYIDWWKTKTRLAKYFTPNIFIIEMVEKSWQWTLQGILFNNLCTIAGDAQSISIQSIPTYKEQVYLVNLRRPKPLGQWIVPQFGRTRARARAASSHWLSQCRVTWLEISLLPGARWRAPQAVDCSMGGWGGWHDHTAQFLFPTKIIINYQSIATICRLLLGDGWCMCREFFAVICVPDCVDMAASRCNTLQWVLHSFLRTLCRSRGRPPPVACW